MRNFSTLELRTLVIVPIVDYAPRDTSGTDSGKDWNDTFDGPRGGGQAAHRRRESSRADHADVVAVNGSAPARSGPAELVAVTALIAHVTDTHALEVRAGVDHIDLGDELLGTISVDLLVAQVSAAERLATRLRLLERSGHHPTRGGGVAWRCWSGWLTGARWGLPVSLHLTTLDR